MGRETLIIFPCPFASWAGPFSAMPPSFRVRKPCLLRNAVSDVSLSGPAIRGIYAPSVIAFGARPTALLFLYCQPRSVGSDRRPNSAYCDAGVATSSAGVIRSHLSLDGMISSAYIENPCKKRWNSMAIPENATFLDSPTAPALLWTMPVPTLSPCCSIWLYH